MGSLMSDLDQELVEEKSCAVNAAGSGGESGNGTSPDGVSRGEESRVGDLTARGGDLAVRGSEVGEFFGKLSEPKKKALENLMWGNTMSDTARLLGVSRMTIHRWLKNDPVFRAAYNEWNEHCVESHRARILMMCDRAMDAVDNALHTGDARLGMQLLKGMGLIKELKPGATDAEEIRRNAAIKKGRKEKYLSWEEMEVGMG